MSKVKGARKPSSAKGKSADFIDVSHDDVYGNPLKLDKELEKELKEKGLVARFINAGTLYKNQGYHNAGWIPYKRGCDTMEQSRKDFHMGSDPEGIIRRGDCILAVKSEEAVEKQKAFLRKKADRYKGFTKQKAQELRQMARDIGGATIHEGYDEE